MKNKKQIEQWNAELDPEDLLISETEILDFLYKNIDEQYGRGYLNSVSIIRATMLLTTSCQVRKAINKLRQKGWTIISNSRGYKLSYDKAEVHKYCSSLRNRIDEMNKGLDGILNSNLMIED